MVAATTTLLSAAEAEKPDEPDNGSTAWREKAGEYARILSRVEWTPVAEGMPMRGKGHFKKGAAYTGVPYSSVKSEGRYIGFDIFLKTFTSENMDAVMVYLHSEADGYDHRTMFLTDEDRRNGKVVIPAGVLGNAGRWQVWLIGENRYGRLKKRHDLAAARGPKGSMTEYKGGGAGLLFLRMAVWQMG